MKQATPARRRPAEPVGALRTREPIYAQLVEEWRAKGRTLPTEPAVPRATCAGQASGPRPEGESP